MTNEQNMNRNLQTGKEAAGYLRISRAMLWRLRRAGEIPFYRIGGKVLYSISDLDAFLDQHRSGGESGNYKTNYRSEPNGL